jgi:hypothetical protein
MNFVRILIFLIVRKQNIRIIFFRIFMSLVSKLQQRYLKIGMPRIILSISYLLIFQNKLEHNEKDYECSLDFISFTSIITLLFIKKNQIFIFYR